MFQDPSDGVNLEHLGADFPWSSAPYSARVLRRDLTQDSPPAAINLEDDLIEITADEARRLAEALLELAGELEGLGAPDY